MDGEYVVTMFATVMRAWLGQQSGVVQVGRRRIVVLAEDELEATARRMALLGWSALPIQYEPNSSWGPRPDQTLHMFDACCCGMPISSYWPRELGGPDYTGPLATQALQDHRDRSQAWPTFITARNRGGSPLAFCSVSGDTMLHTAARHGHLKIVKYLLGELRSEDHVSAISPMPCAIIQLTATNRCGETALDLAQRGRTREHARVVTLLETAGSIVAAIDARAAPIKLPQVLLYDELQSGYAAQQEMTSLKNQGNLAYQARHDEVALQYWRAAARVCADQPAHHADRIALSKNITAVLLRLQQWDQALAEIETGAVPYASDDVKVLYRWGLAQERASSLSSCWWPLWESTPWQLGTGVESNLLLRLLASKSYFELARSCAKRQGQHGLLATVERDLARLDTAYFQAVLALPSRSESIITAERTSHDEEGSETSPLTAMVSRFGQAATEMEFDGMEAQFDGLSRGCVQCGAQPALGKHFSRCSKCDVRYCCRSHQKLAWKLAHKQSCGAALPTPAQILAGAAPLVLRTLHEFGQGWPSVAEACLRRIRTLVEDDHEPVALDPESGIKAAVNVLQAHGNCGALVPLVEACLSWLTLMLTRISHNPPSGVLNTIVATLEDQPTVERVQSEGLAALMHACHAIRDDSDARRQILQVHVRHSFMHVQIHTS